MRSHAKPGIATGEVLDWIEEGHEVCAYTVLKSRESDSGTSIREMFAGIVSDKAVG
jgi:hypothetical protein